MAVALCTLVEIRGGSSRALGAHMAVRADGNYCGYISGGCTEAAVAAEAVLAIANGTDRFLMIGEGSPFFDIVLPCGGGITIAIHVLRNQGPITKALADLERRRAVTLCYHPGQQSLNVTHGQQSAGWCGDTFLTFYRPRPRLFVSGRSIETYQTARIAEAAGYNVVCHNPEPEKPVLRAAFREEPFYIGALGSSRTHEKRTERLLSLGFGIDKISQVKAPIGLFGKARDAQTLALSVLADIASRWQMHATIMPVK
jgi:xanthine dehydrogenase accessory factor